jgi:hypothetical protein
MDQQKKQVEQAWKHRTDRSKKKEVARSELATTFTTMTNQTNR